MSQYSGQGRIFRFICTILLGAALTAGCTLNLPDFKNIEKQGDAFARESIQEIGQNWDSKPYLDRVAPNMLEAGDPAPLFKTFAEKLGPVKKMGELEHGNTNVFAGISSNRPDFTGSYKCKVECQLAPATVTVQVIHKDNKWMLSSFNVYGDALKDMNKEELSGSKAFVEQITPELCKTLSVDCMKKYGDTLLTAELKDGMKTMAVSGVFMAVSKTLGTFKKCDSPKSEGFSLFQGQFVYNYTAQAQFEHGQATLSIVTVKQDGKWRLRGFHVQGHS